MSGGKKVSKASLFFLTISSYSHLTVIKYVDFLTFNATNLFYFTLSKRKRLKKQFNKLNLNSQEIL